ncbi:B-cell receptor-associated protein 31 isoform X1 [Callithrix jacchus]|nr:B-cell receptor-associated protein 31 isoform X1 [Callithrix jacchus]XP_035143925.1 B-cell receptor-associated protein 31 isoform X1 [Callithrix jacchus]XP_035143926.1 B-cell receptor-associated protein 31 isoform X1 [Callithrix jacchus]
MSLQWTAVATFLYAEVFVVLLLCIPFISPKRWQKIFKSRLVELVVSYGNTFFVVLIVILVLLVIDAVREIRKYDDVTEKVNLQNNPGAMEHFHMKLFRAQRNLYIAGFSLLLSFLLRRLVTLISQQATLLASNEAFKKQAESASEAAKKYMEENDQLKKGAAVDGGKLDVGNAEVKLEEENRSLKADLQKLKDELASTKQKLEKAENQALAMRKQSEGLTKEYDRLLEEHAKLQDFCPFPGCSRWSHGQEGGVRASLPTACSRLPPGSCLLLPESRPLPLVLLFVLFCFPHSLPQCIARHLGPCPHSPSTLQVQNAFAVILLGLARPVALASTLECGGQS